jgi:hypothetical protein
MIACTSYPTGKGSSGRFAGPISHASCDVGARRKGSGAEPIYSKGLGFSKGLGRVASVKSAMSDVARRSTKLMVHLWGPLLLVGVGCF